jgi:hypothetical protein
VCLVRDECPVCGRAGISAFLWRPNGLWGSPLGGDLRPGETRADDEMRAACRREIRASIYAASKNGLLLVALSRSA